MDVLYGLCLFNITMFKLVDKQDIQVRLQLLLQCQKMSSETNVVEKYICFDVRATSQSHIWHFSNSLSHFHLAHFKILIPNPSKSHLPVAGTRTHQSRRIQSSWDRLGPMVDDLFILALPRSGSVTDVCPDLAELKQVQSHFCTKPDLAEAQSSLV